MSYNQNQGGGNYRQGGGGFRSNDWQGGGGGGGGNSNGGGYGGNYNNGGNRKRGRDDDFQNSNNSRRRPNEGGNFSSPRRRDGRDDRGSQNSHHNNQSFKQDIWRLGAAETYNASTDIPALASDIQRQYDTRKPVILEAIRVGVTELPQKIPHYVALLVVLSKAVVAPPPEKSLPLVTSIPGLPARPVDAVVLDDDGNAVEPPATPMVVDEEVAVVPPPAPKSISSEIIADIAQALQVSLDKRMWRNARYCILLFCHLATLPDPLVSSTSVISLLTSFLDVLDEPGLHAARGDECVKIIVEALLRLGPTVEGTDGLKDGIQAYQDTRQLDRMLFGDAEISRQFEDPLETLLSTLSSDFAVTSDVLPLIYLQMPTSTDNSIEESPLELPSITIPPHLTDAELLNVIVPPASSTGLRGDEGVGYEGVRMYLRLFEDASVPGIDTPSGAIIRSLIHDVIHLYEVNRKECAKILLSLRRWFTSTTFAPKEKTVDSSEWILENLVVESIISSIFALPLPSLPLAYYSSLLTELCVLSPQTVAPALGKCVRKLYAGLRASPSDSNTILDAEGVKRFSDFFAVHLSNFSFGWGWSDWVADMDTDVSHPQRVFVARTIELEVRLGYYDRVKGSLPEAMYNTGVMADDAPAPVFVFEDSGHVHADSAASLVRLIRAKEGVEEVESELASFQRSLENDHGMTADAADVLKRDLAVQTILHVGSRSFSHFLNVLERYLTLLHNITPSAKTRLELLESVATYWQRNRQFHLIVLDKLLQYRLVDSADVIAWVFSPTAEGKTRKWSDIDNWDSLRSTVKLIESRVEGARGRLAALRREEDARAKEAATVDSDAIVADNQEIVNSTSQLETIEGELSEIISEVIRQFATLLPAATEGKDEWESWWIEGWLREFCRSVSSSLSMPAVIEAVASLKLDADSRVLQIVDSAKAWHEFV